MLGAPLTLVWCCVPGRWWGPRLSAAKSREEARQAERTIEAEVEAVEAEITASSARVALLEQERARMQAAALVAGSGSSCGGGHAAVTAGAVGGPAAATAAAAAAADTGLGAPLSPPFGDA